MNTSPESVLIRVNTCSNPVLIQVCEQCVNVHTQTLRSTLEIEIEAAKWSRVGLRTWGDLVREGAPLKKEVFVKCYPGLDLAVYEEMLREFPSEWKEGLVRDSLVQEVELEQIEIGAMCCWSEERDANGPLGQ